MKTILVCGAGGFVGSALVETLSERNIPTHGQVQSAHSLDADIQQRLDAVYYGDLTDRATAEKIDFQQYSAVINLAGIAINDPNEARARELIENNIKVQTNVADEMIAQGASATRLLAIGSGAIFAQQGKLISETSDRKDPEKATAYVASKLFMTSELQQRADELDMRIAHPFNHSGARQRPGFLVPDWADKLMKWDGSAPVDTSRLSGQVNILHVKDVAQAYIGLATSPELEDYVEFVIGNRDSVNAYAVVSCLAKHLGRRMPQTHLQLAGPVQVDTQRIRNSTNWAVKHTLDETIKHFSTWFTAQVR